METTFESVFMARSSPPGLCNVNILAGNLFLKRPAHIPPSDVMFVTFFGDKKCDVSHLSHLSHFWEECDALAHENIFLTCDVFCHILPEKLHILAPPVKNFFEREEM